MVLRVGFGAVEGAHRLCSWAMAAPLGCATQFAFFSRGPLFVI